MSAPTWYRASTLVVAFCLTAGPLFALPANLTPEEDAPPETAARHAPDIELNEESQEPSFGDLHGLASSTEVLVHSPESCTLSLQEGQAINFSAKILDDLPKMPNHSSSCQSGIGAC